jgi:hypothetical protein
LLVGVLLPVRVEAYSATAQCRPCLRRGGFVRALGFIAVLGISLHRVGVLCLAGGFGVVAGTLARALVPGRWRGPRGRSFFFFVVNDCLGDGLGAAAALFGGGGGPGELRSGGPARREGQAAKSGSRLRATATPYRIDRMWLSPISTIIRLSLLF